MQHRVEDLEGRQFARLMVVRFYERRDRRTYWFCRCACGIEKPVDAAALKAGRAKSCGCLQREKAQGILRTHGKTSEGARPSEYNTWVLMRRRCRTDPRYTRYGITVDPRWEDFEVFFRDVGPKPGPGYSLDRIDNNKGYHKANCRWATQREQTNNTRRNVRLTFQGVTRTVTEWARSLGMHPAKLRKRLRTWSTERALTAP